MGKSALAFDVDTGLVHQHRTRASGNPLKRLD